MLTLLLRKILPLFVCLHTDVLSVGDVGGWVHDNLDVAPPTLHVPVWGTVADVDYAGAQPLSTLR